MKTQVHTLNPLTIRMTAETDLERKLVRWLFLHGAEFVTCSKEDVLVAFKQPQHVTNDWLMGKGSISEHKEASHGG